MTAPSPPTAQPVSTARPDAPPPLPAGGGGSDDADSRGPAGANGPEATKVEDDALLHQFEDMAMAAAKAAKDYRFLMLEHMKIHMTAALSCMNHFAAAGAATTSTADREASEQETDPHPRSDAETAPMDGKTAQEYGVKALGIMAANMNSTLEYARQLTHVKTPDELIALTTSQARKQIEIMLNQTSEIGSMARKLTPQDIASMAGGFAKRLGEQKE